MEKARFFFLPSYKCVKYIVLVFWNSCQDPWKNAHALSSVRSSPVSLIGAPRSHTLQPTSGWKHRYESLHDRAGNERQDKTASDLTGSRPLFFLSHETHSVSQKKAEQQSQSQGSHNLPSPHTHQEIPALPSSQPGICGETSKRNIDARLHASRWSLSHVRLALGLTLTYPTLPRRELTAEQGTRLDISSNFLSDTSLAFISNPLSPPPFFFVLFFNKALRVVSQAFSVASSALAGTPS